MLAKSMIQVLESRVASFGHWRRELRAMRQSSCQQKSAYFFAVSDENFAAACGKNSNEVYEV